MPGTPQKIAAIVEKSGFGAPCPRGFLIGGERVHCPSEFLQSEAAVRQSL
jgi:hypothetical protein